MKISKYNYIIPSDFDSVLIFNGISNYFINLDKNAWILFNQIAKGKKPILNYKGAESDFQTLIKYGIIIEDDVDEINYIKLKNQMLIFQNNALNLTIAPTLGCNFRCSYCYEHKSNVSMTTKTQEKTINFIHQRLKDVVSLRIWWFGGEPLLEKKTIEQMSKQVLSLCKKNGCNYTSAMVTNGYLLNKDTALKLRECEISTLQITLDGPKNIHDKRRYLINGKGSFDQIIRNLIDAVDIIPIINIRINIDKENQNKVPLLLDTLTENGLKNKVKIYFARVRGDSLACQDISENCFESDKFSKIEMKLLNCAVKKGFNIPNIPSSSFISCGSLNINSYLIGPSGELYKCWNTIGMKNEQVGTVDAPLKFNTTICKWLLWNPFSYKKCRECNIFPLCMGGCPSIMFQKKLKEPQCREWKNNLEERLKLHYQLYLQHKKINNINNK